MKFLLVLFVFFEVYYCQLFIAKNVPKWSVKNTAKVVGSRLLLTPILEEGNDLRARQQARVDPKLFLGVTSYSGYFTVDKEHKSNLWFWFFPAQGSEHLYDEDNNDEDEFRSKRGNITDSPLVLWLQGGPGSSSLFGLFTENGPFVVNEDKVTIRLNNQSWHRNYSMIFFDQPVGTGFSFTDKYTTNVTQSSKHMHNAMMQFFRMFPWLQQNEFFITGESYAGKYIPGLAHEIFEQNELNENEFNINLKGLAIGNGFTDPINMLHYSEFAFQLGLVDYNGYNVMKLYEILAEQNIDEPEANIYWNYVFAAFFTHSKYENLYNMLEPRQLNVETYLEFMNLAETRRAVHVGDQEFQSPNKVYFSMQGDFMQSSMPIVEGLLEKGLRIMFYSGNLDFICAYPLSENAFRYMRWSGADEYRSAKRNGFYLEKKLVGYVRKSKNFADATILNAGHMVPTDQPEAMLKLLHLFITNKL